MTPIYDFNSWELGQGFADRPAALFKDKGVASALVIMPDEECVGYIRSYGRPIEATLGRTVRDCQTPDLKDCDLYTYGLMRLLFSERAVSSLSAMRGFTDHLAKINVKNRPTPLYLYYAQGRNLIRMDSRFDRMIGPNQSIPVGLAEARFIEGSKADADIFLINNPSPSLPRSVHLAQTFVTGRFKEAWEKAGLVGAQFVRVGELPR